MNHCDFQRTFENVYTKKLQTKNSNDIIAEIHQSTIYNRPLLELLIRMAAPYTSRNDPIDIIPVEQQTGRL